MKRWMGILLTALLLTGCAEQQAAEPVAAADENAEPNSRTVFAMDTVMELSAYGADDALMEAAEQEILGLESRLSVTDAGSEIYALDHNGLAELSPDTTELMQTALEMCERTDGALDVSIYPVLRAWGFTTGSYQVPTQEEIENLLTQVDYRKVTLENGTASIAQGMEVDLGSVAKGYTGDQVSQLLREGGVTSALLNLGGNVQLVGGKPDGSDWRVAVQDPESDGYLGVLSLRDKAAITSGGYERYFVGDDGEVYWHIIDPATGYPADSGLRGVTVIDPCSTRADALTTALFVMGLDKGMKFCEENKIAAVFITSDKQVYTTSKTGDYAFEFLGEKKGYNYAE